jgi:hypothetical protein
VQPNTAQAKSTSLPTRKRPRTAPEATAAVSAGRLNLTERKKWTLPEVDPDAETEPDFHSGIDGEGLDSCPLTSQK